MKDFQNQITQVYNTSCTTRWYTDQVKDQNLRLLVECKIDD